MSLNAYQSRVLFDKPKLFLPMNDASGPLLDITGNGYDAEVFGSPLRNSTFGTVSGVGGFKSDNVLDGYAIIQNPLTWLYSSYYTVEFWLKADPTPLNTLNTHHLFSVPASTDSTFWSYGASTTTTSSLMSLFTYWVNSPATFTRMCHSYSLSDYQGTTTNRDDKARAYIGGLMNTYSDASFGSVSGNNSPTIPLIHIVAVVHHNTNNGSHLTIYKNGVAVDTSATQQYHFNLAASHFFGPGIFCHPTSKASGVLKAHNAWMSHLAMYDYPLTSEQVLFHYQEATGVNTGNVVAGSTLLEGLPAENILVRVHRRDTGAAIGECVSDANGFFECKVGSYADKVYAVAFDPVSGVNYPAQVFDLIVPGA